LRAHLVVVVILLAIFGSIAAFLYNKFSTLAATDFTPPPIAVGATYSHTSSWPSQLEAVGTIRALRGVELAAEAAGEVTAIHAKSGQALNEGDLILTLNDNVEQAAKKRQEANLKLARLLYERDARLVKQKSIPQSQYDRSEADLDSAIAQLAETEARIANKRIVAPFAGTAGIIKVKVGDYVDTGTAITSLQDLSELEVDFSVPARHAPDLRPGLGITVLSSAFPKRKFRATLEALDARVDSGTRNIMLRAKLAESNGLLPGMFARLIIDLDKPRQVVSVPETAVTYSLHGDLVYVITQVTGGLEANPVVVETGAISNGEIAITKGLLGGERVVTAGQNKLYPGARITIDDSVKF
jgi:membrane fusion protein (multidrug efflux system)